MSPVTDEQVDAALDKVLARYAPTPASLISVLEDLQEDLRFLPRQACERVSTALGVPRSQLYHVATFYKAFSLEPRGRYTISICRGTACHVKGAETIAEMVRTQLKIREDETTEDGCFSLQSVRCLGCCSLAPALMIDGEVYGHVTLDDLRDIIDEYQDRFDEEEDED